MSSVKVGELYENRSTSCLPRSIAKICDGSRKIGKSIPLGGGDVVCTGGDEPLGIAPSGASDSVSIGAIVLSGLLGLVPPSIESDSLATC